jgi:hypothetical protein
MPHRASNIRSIQKALPAMFQAIEGHQEVVWRIQEADLRKPVDRASKGTGSSTLAPCSIGFLWNKYHLQGSSN